jgi:hypothetical protein
MLTVAITSQTYAMTHDVVDVEAKAVLKVLITQLVTVATKTNVSHARYSLLQ